MAAVGGADTGSADTERMVRGLIEKIDRYAASVGRGPSTPSTLSSKNNEPPLESNSGGITYC
jgi:hypothetical protein